MADRIDRGLHDGLFDDLWKIRGNSASTAGDPRKRLAGNVAAADRALARLAAAEVWEPVPPPPPDPEPEADPPPPPPDGDEYPRPVYHPDGSVTFRGHTWTPADVIGPGQFDTTKPITRAGAWVKLGPNDVAPAWLDAPDVLVTGGRRNYMTFRAHRCHAVGVHFPPQPIAGDSFNCSAAVDGCSIVDCTFAPMPPLSTNPSAHPDHIQLFGPGKRDWHIVGNRAEWHDARMILLAGGVAYPGLVIRENVVEDSATHFDIQVGGGPDGSPTVLEGADVRDNLVHSGAHPAGDHSGVDHLRIPKSNGAENWSMTNATFRL